MAKVKVYNWEGQEVGVKELKPEIFEIKARPGLIHRVSVALLGNRRQVLAHTKTKGEVHGGGIKPWKQKGTGRARTGSIRSPLWKGGGVIFGPRKDRNFKVKINKQEKKLAFKMVLSDKVKNEQLLLLENFDLSEPKTKKFVALLKKLPVAGKILLVMPVAKENARLASRNIPKVDQADLGSVSMLDLLSHRTVVACPEAIAYWEKTYSKK